jgi:hypothetical protein
MRVHPCQTGPDEKSVTSDRSPILGMARGLRRFPREPGYSEPHAGAGPARKGRDRVD